MEGTVTDPSGAVVASAVLTATHMATRLSFSARSDETGQFHFPVLPVGLYDVQAAAPGFARLIHKGVVVGVGAKLNLPLQLRLGQSSETVVVTGDGPLIESTRTQVSSRVDSRSVASLPVNGRNFLDFVLLTPGVTRDAFGGLSFGGQRKSNSLLVDGADNNDNFFGEALSGIGFANRPPYQFSLAAVEEFQVSTNSYSAEFGRAGAGTISVVTKSGANEFHGSLFWDYRDRSMNATDVVDKNNGEPKAPYHYNQFGAAAGGPVRKNKAFFFLNYDGQRSTLQNLVVLNLPVGFQLSPNPGVAPFQQQALAYLTPRAAPWIQTLDQNVYYAKLDWHLPAAHQLMVRWNRQRFTGLGLENRGPQNSSEHTGTLRIGSDTAVAALTSVISSSLVNVARFAYAGGLEQGEADSVNAEATVFEAGQLVLTAGRNANSPRHIRIRQFQWSDTLSWAGRGHTFQAGGDVLLGRISFFTSSNFSGSYRFNSLESFGRSMSGMPAPQTGERYIQAFSGDGTSGILARPNFLALAGFFQDEWRVHPQLTLRLGLRYEVQVLARPRVRNPAASLAAAGLDTSAAPLDGNNLAPRLGLAWSPLGSDRLVMRLGYGVFYSLTYGIMASRAHFQNGLTTQTLTFLPGTPGAAFIPAYPNSLCGPPDPTGLPPSCAAPPVASSPLLMLFARDFVQPYVQQGSVGVEYAVKKDLVVSAGYLAVKGTRLHRIRDINLNPATSVATIGVAQSSAVLAFQRFSPSRPIAGFDRIMLFEGNANSIYHALVVQARKRVAQDFQISAAYTLSKVLDDGPEVTAVNPGIADRRLNANPANTRADRGPGINDQRHRLVASGIWELNFPGKLTGVTKGLLEGWELGGIFTAQSGQPYSGLVSFDLNNDSNNATDRTPGLGRHAFYPPATVSLDMRVTRSVHLAEGARLRFTAEAFNLFNRANIIAARNTQFARSTLASACGIAGTPCLVPQANFGDPMTSSGPRIIQLAIKILF